MFKKTAEATKKNSKFYEDGKNLLKKYCGFMGIIGVYNNIDEFMVDIPSGAPIPVLTDLYDAIRELESIKNVGAVEMIEFVPNLERGTISAKVRCNVSDWSDNIELKRADYFLAAWKLFLGRGYEANMINFKADYLEKRKILPNDSTVIVLEEYWGKKGISSITDALVTDYIIDGKPKTGDIYLYLDVSDAPVGDVRGVFVGCHVILSKITKYMKNR